MKFSAPKLVAATALAGAALAATPLAQAYGGIPGGPSAAYPPGPYAADVSPGPSAVDTPPGPNMAASIISV